MTRVGSRVRWASRMGVVLSALSSGVHSTQAYAQTQVESPTSGGDAPAAGEAAFPEEAPSEQVETSPAPAEAPQAVAPAVLEPPAPADSGASASADATAPDQTSTKPAMPTSREPGFYLHLSGGLAYNWARTNEGETTSRVKYDGWSTNLFASAGYMVAPGLAVHGDLHSLFSFDVNVDDPGNGASVTSDGSALSVMSLGAGLTYHFMPVDLFLTASAGVARGNATEWAIVTDENGNEATVQRVAATEPGFAAHVAAGKLFFVSPEWALGGGIHYNYASFSPSSDQNPDTLALERIHSVWLAFEAVFQP